MKTRAPVHVQDSPRAADSKSISDRLPSEPGEFVDHRASNTAQRALGDLVGNSSRISQQTALADRIHNSARMVAQRQRNGELFGDAIRRTAETAGTEGVSQRMGREADQTGTRVGRLSAPATRPLSSAQAPPLQAQPVLQGKDLQLDTHGKVWVPDDMNLTPDQPVFGGTSNVGNGLLKHKAASSMEVLVTPSHPKGSEPKSLDNLFEGLPTKGKYKIAANAQQPKDGSTLYIKGHLLNDNLGGPGTAENLYPITHQANVDHDLKVEEPIKDHVNKEGGAVHYKVVVTKTGQGNTALYTDDNKTVPLQYVNAKFDCAVTEYGSDQSKRSHAVTIDSVWSGTDNKGVDPLDLLKDGEHGKASTFDVGKVLIMPRAQAKKIWDTNLIKLAEHLAQLDKSTLEPWLVKNLKGVGKVGAKLLTSGEEYDTLQKAGKRTLTTARMALDAFLKTNHQIYLTVTGGYDESTEPEAATDEATVDAGTVAAQAYVLAQAIDVMDELCINFSKLSISSGVLHTTGRIDIENPYPKYGETSVSTMSATLDFYDDSVTLTLDILTSKWAKKVIIEDYTSQAKKIAGDPPYDAEARKNIKETLIWGLNQ